MYCAASQDIAPYVNWLIFGTNLPNRFDGPGPRPGNWLKALAVRGSLREMFWLTVYWEGMGPPPAQSPAKVVSRFQKSCFVNSKRCFVQLTSHARSEMEFQLQIGSSFAPEWTNRCVSLGTAHSLVLQNKTCILKYAPVTLCGQLGLRSKQLTEMFPKP